MVFRTGGAAATLFVALLAGGGQSLAQYSVPPGYPPAQAYPPPQGYPPAQAYPAAPGYPTARPLPPAAADDEDDAPYAPPMVLGRPVPPAPIGPQVYEPAPPPGASIGRAPLGRIQEAELPPPAAGQVYRDAPPPAGYVYRDPSPPPAGYVYRDAPLPPAAIPQPYYRDGMAPQAAVPQPGYRDGPPPAYPDALPPGTHGAYEPSASGTRPYYGPGRGVPPPVVYPAAPSEQQDAYRPPRPIGPAQSDPGATGALRSDPRTHMAALPPEVRPETGPRKELPPQFRRTLVDYQTKEPPGTIIIDTQNTFLYLTLGNGKAMRYGVGVGREGFTWSGAEKVTKMAEWPDWFPPTEMIERQPYLPRFMAGGDGNPLGARALYLGKTVYRIHGTNQPSTIGTFVSSGCIRLTNEDVMDLYSRVKVGTRVVVLPGSPPPGASATAPGAPSVAVPSSPPVSMAPSLGRPPVTVAR